MFYLPVHMKRAICILIVFLGCVATATPQAVSVAEAARRERDRRRDIEASGQELVQQVMQYSGGAAILNQLSKSFRESSDKMFERIPAEAREPFRKSAIESLSSARLLPIFEKTFATSMDPVAIGQVARWYKTPAGVRIFQVESHGTGRPDEDFLKRPVPSGRVELIEELDHATRSTERTVAAIAAMTKAMLAGMFKISTDSQADKDAFLLGFEKGFSASAAAPISASIRQAALFSYRDVSDDDLREYLGFLTTPAGRNFVSATWTALTAAMQQGGADAGAAFAQIFKQYNSSKAP
jgi:hypothetical protein